jgi:hypothetical protein
MVAILILAFIVVYIFLGAIAAGVARRMRWMDNRDEELVVLVIGLWPCFLIAIPMLALYRFIGGVEDGEL